MRRSTWTGGEYTVKVVRDIREWEALEPVWDRLLARIPERTVFQTYDYQRLWWRHFGGDNELFIAVVLRDGAIAGIAPLQIQPVKLYGRYFRLLGFIGSRWEVDRPRLLFPEEGGALSRALVRFLTAHPDRWDLCDLHEQPTGSDGLEALESAFQDAGYLVARSRDSDCAYLAIEGTWQQFLAGKSQTFRKNLKTAGRRLRSAGEVDYQVYRTLPEALEQLERYREVEARSWKSGQGVGVGRDDDHFEFYREMAQVFGRRGEFVIRMLRVDDKAVAGTFGLLHDGVFYSLQIAHDRDFSRSSPGTYLEGLEMEQCFADGCREYEFLGGFLNNKSRWTSTFRYTTQLHVYRRTPFFIALHALMFRIKPVVKELVRPYMRSWRQTEPAGATDRWLTFPAARPEPSGSSRSCRSARRWGAAAPRAPGPSRWTSRACCSPSPAPRASTRPSGRSACAPGAVVLCPSYNCGHEIEPLIRLGLRVRCYRVGGDLEVDLDDLRRRMDREVKAVLVTHYFGFGQPLDELKTLCDRRGVFLVEDCAHALFSDNASGDLGRAGDAAVYSIRKTLPLPNGGAVLFNNPGIPMPAPLDPPPMLTTWLKALDLTRKSVVDRVRRDGSWTDLLPMAAMVPLVGGRELLIRLHPAQGTACYDPDDENLGFDSRIMDWSMSPYSAALLNRIDARRHRRPPAPQLHGARRGAARRARGEAAPARAAGPHLSALSAGRGGEPGPGLPAPGAAPDLSGRLVGRATPGGRLERVPGGGGAEGAGPGAAGAPGRR